MTNEEIRELIQLVTETGVAELEVQRGENRVRIRQVVRRRDQRDCCPQSPRPCPRLRPRLPAATPAKR